MTKSAVATFTEEILNGKLHFLCSARIAKESSLQIFRIDLFVKGAYDIVKILHKYNGLCRNNRLLI